MPARSKTGSPKLQPGAAAVRSRAVTTPGRNTATSASSSGAGAWQTPDGTSVLVAGSVEGPQPKASSVPAAFQAGAPRSWQATADAPICHERPDARSRPTTWSFM